MNSRFTYRIASGFLLQLAVFAGLSLGGMHVHHHGDVTGLHVAAGSQCGSDCHDVCETESPTDHLLEILGSAAKVSLPGEYLSELQAGLRSLAANEIDSVAKLPAAPPDRFVAPPAEPLPALSFHHNNTTASFYRFGFSPRAPPAFAS